MVIIGFPAIGKSSVANKPLSDHPFSGYIDLESSNFIKDENWVQEYCNVALDLSSQGYDVFVSSHKEVREYLAKYQDEDDIIEVFPSVMLHDIWIERLRNRYAFDDSDKNYRAYKYMNDNYYTAVEDMEQDSITWKIRLTKYSHFNDLDRTIGEFCMKFGL